MMPNSNDPMRNGILISIITTDLEAERSTYWETAARLYREHLPGVFLLMIYQTNNIPGICPASFGWFDKVLYVDIFSVSNARNVAIDYAQINKFQFIVLSDSSIVPNLMFIRSIAIYSNVEAMPMMGAVLWEDFKNIDLLFSSGVSFEQKKINLLVDGFVWAHLLKISLIGDLRFDLRLGGGGTVINCGEDVVFMYKYFEKNKIKEIMFAENACLIHPPRERDYSKHLKYAFGQGVLYRYLTKNSNSLYTYLMFILFWINAVWGIMCCRPNSINILRERLSGYFDRRTYRKAFDDLSNQ